MNLTNIPKIRYTDSGSFFLIAGPCAIEGEDMAMRIAEHIVELTGKYRIPYIFKGSFKKANRSRLDSFTGIGDEKALRILRRIGEHFRIPVLTDIHKESDAAMAAEYVDVLQIPAFLARQTDLLVAAARTGKTVNIKKGQFMNAGSMRFAAGKVFAQDNPNVLLTERGNMFGYGDLVVDFRNIPALREIAPVVLDVTHSLQRPNQDTGVTGGNPRYIGTLARAGIAAGVDGIFLETHPEPGKALSDGANMLRLELLDGLLNDLSLLKQTMNRIEAKTTN